jgi:hypothetical protein
MSMIDGHYPRRLASGDLLIEALAALRVCGSVLLTGGIVLLLVDLFGGSPELHATRFDLDLIKQNVRYALAGTALRVASWVLRTWLGRGEGEKRPKTEWPSAAPSSAADNDRAPADAPSQPERVWPSNRASAFTRRSVSSPWSAALTSSSIVARLLLAFLRQHGGRPARIEATQQTRVDERFHALPLKMRLRARMPRPLRRPTGPVAPQRRLSLEKDQPVAHLQPH